jgi:Na+/H+ antiporter NhaA
MIDVKLGVLIGSLLSAVAGSILISWSQTSKNPKGEVE